MSIYAPAAAAGYLHVSEFGAVGDGASHPLSAYFDTLAAAQAVYPHADSLTNEIDWAAIQASINRASNSWVNPTGYAVWLGCQKHYIVNKKLNLANGVKLSGPAGGRNQQGYSVKLNFAGLANDTALELFNTEGVTLEGFFALGPAGPGGNSTGVNISECGDPTVRDVFLQNFFRGYFVHASAHVLLEKAKSNGAKYAGLHVGNGSNNITSLGSLYQNVIGGGGAVAGANILIDGNSYGITILDSEVDESFQQTSPVRLGACRHVVINGTKIFATEGTAGYGVRLGDGANNPTDCTLLGVRVELFGGPDRAPVAGLSLYGSGHKLVACEVAPNGGDFIDDHTTDTHYNDVRLQANARGQGGAFAAMAGETFDLQIDALGWQTVTFGTEATLAAAVATINAVLGARGGAAQHTANTGQVDLFSKLCGPGGRVRTQNVVAGVTAKLGILNNVDVTGRRITSQPALEVYANNAAALAGGLVAGNLYMVTGSDPRQVAVTI